MSTRYTPHMRPRPEVDTSVVVPLDVRLMHVASSSLLVGLLVAALVMGLWALTRLPIFALAGITVLGDVEHNNAVTLRANVVTRLSGNFFTTDLDRVQAAFQAVPWVRSASVAREFPNRLRVTLQEHSPVAFWGDDGESRMVNSYGEVFEANVGEVEDDKMPRLRGPDSQSQQVLAMYSALKPVFAGLNLPLESLELTGRGSWRARVAQGAVIELGRGSTAEVMVRMQRLGQTLVQATLKLGRKVAAIESADLRYDNGYALRLRGVSTTDVPTAR